MNRKKKIAILGATGSIGNSTLQVIRQHADLFEIVYAVAHSSYRQLVKIAAEFQIPRLNLCNDQLRKEQISSPACVEQISFGSDQMLQDLEEIECDIILNAISGSAGLSASILSIRRGIDLALANKESLVMAGHIINEELKISPSKLLPVDSEHSAIFQAIGETSFSQVSKIILTASGGPFLNLPLDQFDKITLAQTLKHPTWKMGRKITVDSATMMNKGLEVIEAKWLFLKDFPDISAVIHPQSIVHSFIQYLDGSLLAQMSFPSMQLPILYALTHPHHIRSEILQTNILDLPDLSFQKLDKNRYPLYYLARQVGKTGGLLPTIMNSANEAAIDLFLAEKISFNQIHQLIEQYLQHSENLRRPTLNDIILANNLTFKKVKKDYKNYLNF
ncbi:MAG: 1-deoxy-D-xylulose-5-phosphate reductoisomerase [Candidatus Cloacimonadales bacterium]